MIILLLLRLSVTLKSSIIVATFHFSDKKLFNIWIYLFIRHINRNYLPRIKNFLIIYFFPTLLEYYPNYLSIQSHDFYQLKKYSLFENIITLSDCPKTDLKPIPLKPVLLIEDFLVPLSRLHILNIIFIENLSCMSNYKIVFK